MSLIFVSNFCFCFYLLHKNIYENFGQLIYFGNTYKFSFDFWLEQELEEKLDF